MLPRPPESEVPPITTAAIESNSKLMPALGCAESSRDVTMMPPTAASAPAMVYTMILTLLTLIPDNLEALSLPPIA
jgi:hypothetical protein